MKKHLFFIIILMTLVSCTSSGQRGTFNTIIKNQQQDDVGSSLFNRYEVELKKLIADNQSKLWGDIDVEYDMELYDEGVFYNSSKDTLLFIVSQKTTVSNEYFGTSDKDISGNSYLYSTFSIPAIVNGSEDITFLQRECGHLLFDKERSNMDNVEKYRKMARRALIDTIISGKEHSCFTKFSLQKVLQQKLEGHKYE